MKFVGLPVMKIWRIYCVSVNGPGDLDLSTLKLACESGAVLRRGQGGTGPPNVGPPIILIPTAKIRIVEI